MSFKWNFSGAYNHTYSLAAWQPEKDLPMRPLAIEVWSADVWMDWYFKQGYLTTTADVWTFLMFERNSADFGRKSSKGHCLRICRIICSHTLLESKAGRNCCDNFVHTFKINIYESRKIVGLINQGSNFWFFENSAQFFKLWSYQKFLDFIFRNLAN